MKTEAQIKKDILNWTMRASSAHKFVTHLPGLSVAQYEELFKLQDKENSGKALTALQAIKKEDLEEKRDAPDVLPEGAITELYRVHDEIVYGIKEEVSSREIEKGNLMEQDALQLLADVYNIQNGTNVYLKKNEERGIEDGMSGSWDCCFEDTVIDTKVPWSLKTFRNANSEDRYYWQVQTYIHLTDSKRGIIAYCLLDAPENLIYDEFRKQCYYKGIIDETSEQALEVEEQVRTNMTYENKLSKQARLKVINVERNEEDIEILKRRALMAKEKLMEIYIQESGVKNVEGLGSFKVAE